VRAPDEKPAAKPQRERLAMENDRWTIYALKNVARFAASIAL
jgi:hypothetical protein